MWGELPMTASRGVSCILAVLLGLGSAGQAPAQVNSLGWQDAIVPGGQIGEYRHGTYPSWGNNTHVGYDIVAPCDTIIRSWKRGRVIDVVEKKSDPNFNSLGFMVLMDHSTAGSGTPEYGIYLHMKDPPRGADKKPIAKGMDVAQGETIGLVGKTGAAQGCHLHFEVRRFAERFHPVWANIYGQGDKRGDKAFLQDWSDPGRAIAVKAPSYDAIYVDPRGVMKGVTRLPPKSVNLVDKVGCNKADAKSVSLIVPKGLKCSAHVVDDGVSYLFFPNWMKTPQEPGGWRIVAAGTRPQVLSDIAGTSDGLIVAIKVEGQYLEFLSIAPQAKYSEKAGHPYNRYRLIGNPGARRLQLLPSTMFPKGKSPVDLARQRVIEASRPAPAVASAPRATNSTAANPINQTRPSASYAPEAVGATSGSACGAVRRDGVIHNLGDYFQCDEAAAIRGMQVGKRIVFNPGSVAFTEGKFVATMRQKSEEVLAAQRRMDEHGERVRSNRPMTQRYEQNNSFWGDWNRVTQSTPFTIVCKFSARQVVRDEPIVVFAKLVTYSSRTAILDCS